MPRRDGRSSFEKLKEYLAFEPKAGTGERVKRGPMVLSDNLLSLDTAAQEMRAAASRNYVAKHPVMHFQLSWKPGEVPTEAQWLYAAKRSIEALGFAEHQFLIAAHDDKEHFHVHVMLNRVHPETAKAHNPRLTQLTLHKVARELEHGFGWAETEGLFRWDKERNEAVRNTRAEMREIREKREQTPGKESEVKARQDHFRDEPSLRAFASKQPAETLSKLMAKETNWQQVHLALARHGLSIHKAEKGGYTVGVEGTEIRVKASDVFRFAFSGKEARAKTESVLGAFQPAKFGKVFDPPVVDYNREMTPAGARRNGRAFLTHHASLKNTSWGQNTAPLSGSIRTINDLPRLSGVRPIPSVQVDRMSIQEITHGTPGLRAGVRLVVQPGNQPQTPQGTAGNRPAQTAGERRQQWLDKEAEAGQQRRQQRIEERARERLELKREFQVARADEKAALHRHTLSARARRLELLAHARQNKVEIRSLDVTWQAKKSMRSVAEAELLLARQKLRGEIAEERRGIPGRSYQQWVEQKAEAGDKRAAAQMRGWRYQDSRNLRKIDQNDAKAVGELQARTVLEPARQKTIDWQELANERVRQMKEQPALREAVDGLRWRADSKTGDVVYSVHGAAGLIDQGKKITVLTAERNATRVALQIALHKYGGIIEAKGTAAWQDQLIQAAIQDNVRVVFTDPELQRRLVAARQAARDKVKPAGPDLVRAGERFQHFDDQLMKRYGYGLDTAKADRLIAGSMAAAGSSEEEIAGALRELSRQGRETKRPADEAYCMEVAAGAVSQITLTKASEHKGIER